ncbi:hypothetical protein [Sulfurimonas sp.]|uniref:hypothetical protein n=1 Tax=Sulfurimonas sp. TaxID=2022749 RepID=UPI00356A2379
MGIFSKILGNKNTNKDSKNEKLLEKIEKMDLNDMRLYVNGKFSEFEVSEYGLSEILKKITLKNENTGQCYLKEDDMDSKMKKVFELVILILSNKKISIYGLEISQKFLETYEKIIKKYDKENKQIYENKIKESISKAADKINFKSDVADRMRTLS